MNGWTPQEINRLEERAAREPSVWKMMHLLQRETGLGFFTCAAWAKLIVIKYGNGRCAP
jgi:hypothetical protein